MIYDREFSGLFVKIRRSMPGVVRQSADGAGCNIFP